MTAELPHSSPHLLTHLKHISHLVYIVLDSLEKQDGLLLF